MSPRDPNPWWLGPTPPSTGSRRYKLNKEDLVKLLTSATLVGATAAGVFLLDALSLLDFSSLGQWAAPAGAFATFAVNFLRKWLANGPK